MAGSTENITGYLARERRDFEEYPLNDVDLLVFAALAYLELERYPAIAGDEPAIGRLGEYGPLRSLVEHDCNSSGMLPFLEALVVSPRFSGIPVCGFESILDEGRLTQFGAVCLPVSPELVVVAFRGTDMSYVGWIEDFDMLCDGAVPCQQEALAYLKRAAGRWPDAEIAVCGHSKGGACAEYATVFSEPPLQGRIARAVSFDGPALYRLGNEDCPELEAYDGIVAGRYRALRAPLVRYIFPSMVGLMFEPPEGEAQTRPFVECVDPSLPHNVCSARVAGGWLVTAPPADGELSAGMRYSRCIRQLDYAERVVLPDFIVGAFSDAGKPVDLSYGAAEVARMILARYAREPLRVRAIVRSALVKFAKTREP